MLQLEQTSTCIRTRIAAAAGTQLLKRIATIRLQSVSLQALTILASRAPYLQMRHVVVCCLHRATGRRLVASIPERHCFQHRQSQESGAFGGGARLQRAQARVGVAIGALEFAACARKALAADGEPGLIL